MHCHAKTMHCHANHMTCCSQWPRKPLNVDQTLSLLEGGVWERDYVFIIQIRTHPKVSRGAGDPCFLGLWLNSKSSKFESSDFSHTFIYVGNLNFSCSYLLYCTCCRLQIWRIYCLTIDLPILGSKDHSTSRKYWVCSNWNRGYVPLKAQVSYCVVPLHHNWHV